MQSTKQKNASVSGKAFLITTLSALVLTGGLRIYQLFTNIEANTGFFKSQNWTVYAVYTAFILSMVVLAVLSFRGVRIPASRPVLRKDRAMVFSGFLFALGLSTDVALSIVELIRAFRSTGGSGTLLANSLFTDGMLVVLLRTICAMLSCVYFVLIALSYATENATYVQYKLLALSPLFWTMFRLVSRFMTKISFLEVSELVFELIELAFMALFFLSFARVSSQIDQKNEMKKVVRYGSLAAFSALFLSLTRLVCVVGGRQELLASGFTFSLADCGFGVFTLCYVYLHLQHGRPASEDNDLESEAQIQAMETKTELDDTFLDEA